MRLYAALLLSSLALFACSNPRSADPAPTAGGVAAPAAPGAEAGASPASLAVFVQAVGRQPTDAKGCLVGCGAYPALPRCAPGLDIKPLAELTASPARDELQGKAVAVRGPLNGQAGCTELGCGAGTCCNSCDGGLFLGQPTYKGYDHLVLANAAFPDSVRCVGDEKTRCCAAPAKGEEVVVTGTLGRTGGSPSELQLNDATLCVP
jgi:hypothetical protein